MEERETKETSKKVVKRIKKKRIIPDKEKDHTTDKIDYL
tara:strand:- start:12 stop:128 length:117 start_codon:yes stop_codon:yes gene_type:complete